MRNALLLLALGGLLLTAAPSAEAQISQYNVVIELDPIDHALAPSQGATAFGQVRMVTDPTFFLFDDEVPIEYAVTALPSWASASVNPPQDVVLLFLGGPNAQGYAEFEVDVHVASDAPAGVVDYVEVVATTSPAGPGAPQKSVSIRMPIQVAAAEEPCEEDHLVIDATGATADEEPAEEDLHVQSGGARPFRSLPWYAAGGFAVAGAGVGLLLRRRMA